jgi:FixJ family two-component response regulator
MHDIVAAGGKMPPPSTLSTHQFFRVPSVECSMSEETTVQPAPAPEATPMAVFPDLNFAGALVYIVDDDVSVRRLVAAVLAAEGIRVEQCLSGEQFLASVTPEQRGCLLLDVDMPGMTGVELHKQLAGRGIHLPVVFLTGVADVDTSVQVMKRGAIDLVQKPFKKEQLLEVAKRALALDAKRAAARRRQTIARARVETLNPREREVMAFVVEGMANKQIARKLELSEKTIEVHRARVMTKMGADSLADLVRLALDAGIGPEAGTAVPPATE